VEEKKPLLEGQVAREDPGAVSAISGLPAFIARPKSAPAYYGFPLLPDSEMDGFVSVSTPARAPMRQLHGATHTLWARMERALGLCGV
jgi:hypothetical protein